MKRRQGFTLIEMLLSLAIISLLMGVVIPIAYSLQVNNDLATTSQRVTEMLRRAGTYARSGNGDSVWGVRLQAGSATLYKGSSYTSRDTSADETYALPASITLSGLGDTQFSKLSGYPTATGTITITSSSNQVDTVLLGSKGVVNE